MWSLCDTDMRPDHTVYSPGFKNNPTKSADTFSFVGDFLVGNFFPTPKGN